MVSDLLLTEVLFNAVVDGGHFVGLDALCLQVLFFCKLIDFFTRLEITLLHYHVVELLLA